MREIYSVYVGDGLSYRELCGNSGEEKPTTGVCSGSLFFEPDTGAIYSFDEVTGDWQFEFSFQG